MTELLSNVSEPETLASFTRLRSIRDLILPELNDYYTYHGSLTTPPCSEVVTWVDFKKSIPLSHAQVNCFLNICDNYFISIKIYMFILNIKKFSM